jgi:hypothetical protein
MPMTTDAADRYAQLRATHTWPVPDRYNIAADVCDARDPNALAMLHEHFEGAVRELYWGELQALSNQVANFLTGLGVGNLLDVVSVARGTDKETPGLRPSLERPLDLIDDGTIAVTAGSRDDVESYFQVFDPAPANEAVSITIK